MLIEKTVVTGFEAALRGARNAMNSWDKSDSSFRGPGGYILETKEYGDIVSDFMIVGSNDLDLFRQLTKRGDSHSKFMRLITVSVDMTLPRYIHQEMDTYKVGTTRLSCSTRPNTLKKIAFTEDMFQIDTYDLVTLQRFDEIISYLNGLTSQYVKTKDKNYLRQIKKLLPESYLQKSTYGMNYQVLRHIYNDRKSHWLKEWEVICDWIKMLPLSFLVTGEIDEA